MRKLKLQMHISIDGFVASNDSVPTAFNWDTELINHSVANLENVDYILIGHKTAVDFIPYWAVVAEKPDAPDYRVGRLLTDIPKVIFSKTVTESKWANAKMASGDLVEEINKLKKEKGNDIMVYGGVEFVSSLVTNQLIDEYHLLVEPIALGSGMPIFKQRTNLKLVKSTPFGSGVVVSQYEPS
jgi:dihydrofolate reductase